MAKKVLPNPTDSDPSDPVPYQCFLSYRRDDNNDFDSVVDVLQSQLSGRFDARTGTVLRIFVDRKEIGWGVNWRQKIADSIAGSTLFIPVITMRYFKSQICREELQAFLAAAKRLGVTDLVLPIVLAGSDNLSDEHEDELVRQVAELNCKFIEAEWECNYQSAEWKRKVGDLVGGIELALKRAAEHLSNSLGQSLQLKDGGGGLIDGIDLPSIQLDIQDLAANLAEVAPPIQKITAVLVERVGERDLNSMTPGQQVFFFGAIAKDITPPSLQFETIAADVESKAVALDARLRAVIEEMEGIESGESADLIAGIRLGLRDMSEQSLNLDQFAEIDQSLRRMALRSVELRKATQPISRGLLSYATAVQVIAGWRDGIFKGDGKF